MPPSAVSLSTSAEGSNIAGESYTIYCMVRAPNMLSAFPEITWIKPTSVEIEDQVNNTVVGQSIFVTSTITFTPLLTSQSGVYTCQVSLQSPSLPRLLNISDMVTVSIQSMYLIGIHIPNMHAHTLHFYYVIYCSSTVIYY